MTITIPIPDTVPFVPYLQRCRDAMGPAFDFGPPRQTAISYVFTVVGPVDQQRRQLERFEAAGIFGGFIDNVTDYGLEPAQVCVFCEHPHTDTDPLTRFDKRDEWVCVNHRACNKRTDAQTDAAMGQT